MTRFLCAIATTCLLAACSDGSERAAEYDLAEAEVVESASKLDMEPGEATSASGNNEIPVSQPQIAYSYDYGFRLPASEIPAAQQQHITLCNSVPDNGCRILNMSNSGGEGDYATGRLHLEVAAPKARAFGEQLAAAVDNAGGSQIAASITGEDLSKQIVDTEARLRSRVLLAERLTELLATRKGSVAELVEAERAVTQVNEEIDQARSWLKEMRGRVSYSKVVVNYMSGAPGSGGFMRPIRDAIGGIASTLGYSIGALISVLAITLPWIFVIALAIYLRRRFKSPNRSFWGRKIVPEPPAED